MGAILFHHCHFGRKRRVQPYIAFKVVIVGRSLGTKTACWLRVQFLACLGTCLNGERTAQPPFPSEMCSAKGFWAWDSAPKSIQSLSSITLADFWSKLAFYGDDHRCVCGGGEAGKFCSTDEKFSLNSTFKPAELFKLKPWRESLCLAGAQ